MDQLLLHCIQGNNFRIAPPSVDAVNLSFSNVINNFPDIFRCLNLLISQEHGGEAYSV